MTPPPSFAEFETSANNMDPYGLMVIPTGWAALLCVYVRELERKIEDDRLGGDFW